MIGLQFSIKEHKLNGCFSLTTVRAICVSFFDTVESLFRRKISYIYTLVHIVWHLKKEIQLSYCLGIQIAALWIIFRLWN